METVKTQQSSGGNYICHATYNTEALLAMMKHASR